MTIVDFKLCAQDPSGQFVELGWTAAIVPRIGDSLMLPDGSDWQDVTVTDVVLYPSGEARVWVGPFPGWEPGSVSKLFETAHGSAHGGDRAA